MWELIYDAFEKQGSMPNKFSIGLGERIKEAREEKGMSQAELAKKIYRRRPSISEMENGKMYPDAATLMYLSHALDKPLLYFIPEFYRRGVEVSDISGEEQELISVFRKLTQEQKKIALVQMKAILNMSND